VKSTGVVRRIDELGRIVIPKEIRRNLGIRDGENIEIFIEDNGIILKKHSMLESLINITKLLGDLTLNIMQYKLIITDREKVVFSFDKTYINKSISSLLIKLIDQRESMQCDDKTVLNFGTEELCGYFSIVPIISSNDSVGLVILYNDKKLGIEEINYNKLLATYIGEKLTID